jgi:hypothetical protein
MEADLGKVAARLTLDVRLLHDSTIKKDRKWGKKRDQ